MKHVFLTDRPKCVWVLMYEIDKLCVNPKVIVALKLAKLYDFKSILFASREELSRATKLSYQEVDAVINAVSQSVTNSKFIPSHQLRKKENCGLDRISVGCKVLDDLLRGGVPTQSITEICGESASGKTQFCLQFSLWAQVPNSQGDLVYGVVYVCTECIFPIKRLHQLIEDFSAITSDNRAKLMDNVTICQIGDVGELKECVQKYLPVLVKARRVRVAIIDSVAAVFRAAYDRGEVRNRAEDLQALGYSLHCLAQRQNLAVVCINQVTDAMSDSHRWCGPMEKVSPALGLSWANMVTTRLMLSRTMKRISFTSVNGREMPLPTPAVICKAKVVYAPDLPSDCFAYYAVTRSGLKGIDAQIFNRSESWTADRITD